MKCDIKKYFYSIDKNTLFNIMKKYIKDYKLLNLTKVFIYDNKEEKGIPIGNYTSQFFANIYLNELDKYIKEELKVKYYVRYMDDFCLLLPNKDICRKLLNKIKIFLNDKLKLDLNIKSRYYPSKFGLNFCGYIIKENKITLRRRFVKNINRKIKSPNFDLLTFKGHLIHANSNNFIVSILRKILEVDGIVKVIYLTSKFEDTSIKKTIEDEINRMV